MDIASVYQFWKNPVILVRIQLEWFIPVDILLLSIKREQKVHRYYFLNGTTQSHSCFLCEKKNTSTICENVFTRNFRTNSKSSLFSHNPRTISRPRSIRVDRG